ncbi:MAG: hypothetical protein U1F77_05045 [Kiritimatiellia bacterium]
MNFPEKPTLRRSSYGFGVLAWRLSTMFKDPVLHRQAAFPDLFRTNQSRRSKDDSSVSIPTEARKNSINNQYAESRLALP